MKTNLDVLRIYEDKVLDLSRRNRLLRFPKGARSVTFLMELDEFQDKFGLPEELNIEFPHKEILKEEEKEEIIQQKLLLASTEDLTKVEEEEEKQTEFVPHTNPTGKKLISSLTSLRLDAKRKFEEHGLHTLFITVGKIKWNELSNGKNKEVNKKTRDKDDFDYVAPILLIPVLISEKKNPKKTVINTYLENNDISFNIALNLLLEKEYSTRTVKIEDILLTDLTELFRNISEQLKSIFEELKVNCEVTTEIQMGQYTFYGQQIYEDLIKHEDEILQNEFINALCTHTPLNQSDLSIESDSNIFFKPETDFNILEADTSQVQVIQNALKGNHLNIQGPPGTGKSQTIVNIISNFLARNKSVLLVCEKNVALEVVLKRLKDKGLEKLCLPLFQYNEDKKTFAKKIIDDRDYITKLNHDDIGLDNILVAREKRIQFLKSYADALANVAEPLHKNVFWVHGELAKNQQLTSLEPLISHLIWGDKNPLELPFEEYEEIMTVLNNMSTIFNLNLDEKHTNWKKLKRSIYSKDLEGKILKVLSKIQKLSNQLETEFDNFSLQSISQIQEFASYLDQIKGIDLDNSKFNMKQDILIIESRLQATLLSANKFIDRRSQLDKTYDIPLAWDDKARLENEKLILNEDVELSTLDNLSKVINQLISLIENLNQSCKKLKDADFLKTGDLTEVFPYKEVINSSVLISKLQKRNKLEDLSSSLEQLETLNNLDHQLKQVKTIFNRWGIIPNTLNKGHKEHAKKFLDEYSNPIKRIPFIFPQYRKDKAQIEEWTIAKSPNSFNEYKEIAIAIRDWYVFQNKLAILTKNFTEEHLAKGKTISQEEVEPFLIAIKTMCEFLQTQEKEELPKEIVNLIEINSNNTDLIFDTMNIISQIYESWSEIENSFKTGDLEIRTIENLEPILRIAKEQVENITSILKNIASVLRSNHPLKISELIVDLSEVNELRKYIQEIEKNNFDEIYLEDNYIEKIINNFDSLLSFSKNLILAREILEKMGIRKDQAEFSLGKASKTVQELKEELPLLIHWFGEYEIQKIELDKLFDCSDSISNFETLSFEEFTTRIGEMLKDTEGLEKWTTYNQYAKQIEKRGIIGFLKETETIYVDNPAALFAISLWNAWLEGYYEQNTVLRDFNVRDQEQIIREFRRLDQQTLEINSDRILNIASGYVKEAKMQGGYRDGELIHQSQLKRMHKPIRKLVLSNGSQIINYKRCWMMSPLTLSSYIPYGSIEFDVVIFDEASQMRVEHALGSIARAKQVIIFGDENQLPPTSFFQITNDSEMEDEDEQDEDYESVLNATKEILPDADRMLNYHYRSKYEDLIAFSNYLIYNDNLITFPNPVKGKSPVEFDYVGKGVFDGGAGGTRMNAEEAKRVAEICIRQAIDDPEKSLGVIAFSRSQEEAIREAVNSALSELPELKSILDEDSEKSEKFFIKNLESVQGDERDIIILSIGYGKDKNGKMYQRFGPINGQNGFRRLNVAVTRAKHKVICISSIKSTDITNADRARRGVFMLQRYLEYAENGRASLDASKLRSNHAVGFYESPFEEEVAMAVRNLGYGVDSQVGASGYKIDLAIVNPKNDEEYILGIECDGAQYHRSYSARVNDRIRQENLKDKGWELFRIWSQHWIRNRELIMNDLVNKLAEIHSLSNKN